jgi:hypothetical protein
MELRAELARKVAPLQTLGDVIAAGFEVVDVVVQDEFAHDVVVRHAVHGDVHLVFDTA